MYLYKFDKTFSSKFECLLQRQLIFLQVVVKKLNKNLFYFNPQIINDIEIH